MEHQKILILLDEGSHSKFVTRKWNIVNYKSNTNYDAGNDTEVLKSNLCDFNDGYILVKDDITVIGHQGTQVAFKNCAQFTKCITRIYETIIDDAEDLDLLMLMYNLTENSSSYSETTGRLWFHSIILFYLIAYSNDDNNFKSFNYGNKGILKNTAVAVPLKYLSNFWRTLEIPLINCKIKLKLKWARDCILSVVGADNNNANFGNINFTIKDTKLDVPVVT